MEEESDNILKNKTNTLYNNSYNYFIFFRGNNKYMFRFLTFHDDGKETADKGETLPGTTVKVVPSYWPIDSDFDEWGTGVMVKAGGVFKYTDGNYYVVTKDTILTKSQANTGPGGDLFSWYKAEKITNRVVTYNGNEQKSDLNRGDMCEFNGAYYVYNNGGSYAYSPAINSSFWYKIP